MRNEFKVGDKVKCVSSAGYRFISKGKTYEVIDVRGSSISVVNDMRIYHSFYTKENFKLIPSQLEESREELLNAIKLIEKYELKRYRVGYEVGWTSTDENILCTTDHHKILDYVLPLEDPNKEAIDAIEKELRDIATRQEELADKLKDLK